MWSPMCVVTVVLLLSCSALLSTHAQIQNACQSQVADVVFLVDTSGSVDSSEWAQQIRFIKSLVNNFTIGPNDVQVGVVTFSDSVQTEFALNGHTGKQAVLTAIDGIQERDGYTHTSAGLRAVRTNAFTAGSGDRANAPNVLIVITDGESTSGYEPNSEADLLKQAGVQIITIGVGSGTDTYELTAVASNPQYFFAATDFAALPAILSAVATTTCEAAVAWSDWGSWSACSLSCGNGIQYRERSCSTADCEGPSREERVCFTPCPIPVCESSVADIVFLLDTSGSISDTQFRQQIQFVRNLVNRFTIGARDIQVGIVTFSDSTQTEFYLNRYSTKAAVLAGITSISQRSGGTHTSDALQYVRQNAFTIAHGDRPDAHNVLIVITDGQSNSGYEPSRQAELLRDADVNIVAIGVGSGSDTAELESMASTEDNVFEVTDFTALSTIITAVQTIACQVCASSVADIVFLLDTSGSISDTQFGQQIQFVRTMVNQFTISSNDIQVAIVTFAYSPQAEFLLNRYSNTTDVLTGVDNIDQRSGGTQTSEALQFVRETVFTTANGDRADANNVLIVITDGQSNAGYDPAIEAQLLRDDHVNIIAIGVGDGSDADELRSMATADNHVFEVTNFTTLPTILNAVQTIACEGYWLEWGNWSSCSQTCGNGTEYRERECNNPSARSSEGCEGPAREQRMCVMPECPIVPACSATAVDIMLLVDASNTIDSAEWGQQLQFIRSMVMGMTFGPNNIRLGMVTISMAADNIFHLNRYSSRSDLLRRIPSISRSAGWTRTSAGFAYIRTDSFRASNGDRANAPNVLIYITDGGTSLGYGPNNEALALRRAGVKIIVIGVGSDTDRSEMQATASSSRLIFQVTSYRALPTILDEVKEAAC